MGCIMPYPLIVLPYVPYVNPHTYVFDLGVGVNPDSAASRMVFGGGYDKLLERKVEICRYIIVSTWVRRSTRRL